MMPFSTVMFAPSDTVTLYFRAWKKWAVGARELTLNLDDISFAGYKELPPPAPVITATATITPTSPLTATVTPTATTTR
jgi:hypothetical protein